MFFHKYKRKIINIEGITSKEHAKKIEEALENLIDITKAKVNINKKQAIIGYDNDVDEILLTNTIEKIGFTVTGIKEL